MHIIRDEIATTWNTHSVVSRKIIQIRNESIRLDAYRHI